MAFQSMWCCKQLICDFYKRLAPRALSLEVQVGATLWEQVQPIRRPFDQPNTSVMTVSLVDGETVVRKTEERYEDCSILPECSAAQQFRLLSTLRCPLPATRLN
jgi:hypothetical protein